jgi:predicted nuclease with TOPRIM domain
VSGVCVETFNKQSTVIKGSVKVDRHVQKVQNILIANNYIHAKTVEDLCSEVQRWL